MGRWNTRLKYFAPILFSVLVVGRVGAQAPDAYLPNYNEGYGIGYTSGYGTGYASGSERGTKEGTTKGNTDGYQAGWDASYQPAYDSAYQNNLPIGQSAGYSVGLPAGLRNGFDWATETYGIIISSGSISGSVDLIAFNDWGGFLGGGTIVSNRTLMLSNGPGGSWGSSSGTIMMSVGGYDWGQHYYSLGYKDGRANGISIGDAAGYDFAYPTAYATAYDAGVQTGTLKGTAQGSSDGATEGYTAGWSLGYGEGYNQGYDAGVYYFLAGGTLPSNGNIAASSSAAADVSVPEPASLTLLTIAAVAFVRRGSRK